MWTTCCTLSERIRAFDARMGIVVRFGVYEVDDCALPVSAMCDRARLASQSVKGRFGAYVARYDEALRGRLVLEQTLTANLEEALAEGQFQTYLQPKCEISTGRVVGAEALVRWCHPTEGFLSPAMFIPPFEKNGFITRLDHYVLEQACAKLAAWRRQAALQHLGEPLARRSVRS